MNKDKLLNDTTSVKSQFVPIKLANVSPHSDGSTTHSPKSGNPPKEDQLDEKGKHDEGKRGKD
ncbi:MAG: hypothetical protein RM347_003420 [Nostoc sp. ChiQUE02]|uniref:hypothetical protein n=1 Tax=Nostoc sp. ChiQUE02 TaxID=3075377 RepID=UPI002AD258A0|nr:hypothetical protein [Nostoc sp. ChiQUE02]MDZ8231064.1 hypothetical protein [Nostoc sp. ChiQUE02]